MLTELEALLTQTPAPGIAIVDYLLAAGPLGLEVALQLHERLPGIKRIMMTGELLLDPQLVATGMPILHKPVSHDQLASVLGQLIALAAFNGPINHRADKTNKSGEPHVSPF